MGWDDRIAEILSTDYMCPAVGQGALAIETRADGGPGQEVCAEARSCPTRAPPSPPNGPCWPLWAAAARFPSARMPRWTVDELHLTAVVCTPDGDRLLRRNASGPAEDAEELGRELARTLLDAGADEILEAVYGGS